MTTDHTFTTPAMDILVVDDTIESLKLLTEILTRAGYRVRPVNGPQLALESALAHPPDLILLDVRMPEMSGFEVCQQLKQDERTSDIPVIFVSALQDVEDRVQGFEVGGVDFVSKPFQESEVLARVKTHLQLRTMQLYMEALVSERTIELIQANEALHGEITERRRVEKALRLSHARHELAAKAGQSGVWDWDLRTNEIFVDPNLKDILGYADHEISNQLDDWGQLVHPDDAEAVMAVATAHIEGRTPVYEITHRMVHRDGSIRWYLARGTALRDENGVAYRLVGTDTDITERKWMEETLRESEERFRATFEQAAVGIAHVALDGHFLRLNQRFCDIVGYSYDEMLARTFQDITHPNDLNTDLEHARQLLVGEVKTYSMEKRYFRKNGEIVWVNLTGSLLRKATGEPDYFIAVVEDITARKKLRDERDRILNLSQDLICVAGMDGYFKYLNPAWERTLGYAPEEFLARPFLDFIHPDDHAKNDAEVEHLAAGHQTLDFENRYICKDGSIRYVSWTATPLLKEKMMYYIGRDITERKQAREALIESEEQFRGLVEQSPLSTQIVNPDGYIEKVNQAFLELWGIPEELLAEVFEKYNMLEDDEATQQGVMPLIKKAFSGQTVTLPVIEYDAASTLDSIGVTGGKGNKRWIQTRLYPVKNSKGELMNVVGMEEDITERRQAEEKLQLYQQRLKALASQLTIAEERERRRIAADLHDEVGQTLAFARIQIATARDTVAEPEAVAMLDDVSDTIRRVIQDTRDLVFDLSSPLLNELGLPAALAEWLEEQVARKHGLQTEFKLAGEKIVLDEDVRAILFRNTRELLTNVVKHAQAGKVSVRLARVGNEALVIVEDDGNGFDPLAAAEAMGRNGGFGLFSIRERMLDLGGSMEIVSEPGQGCTAILTAPLGNN